MRPNSHVTDMSNFKHRINDIAYTDVIKLINAPLSHDTLVYFKQTLDVILNVELAMSLATDRKAAAGRKALKAFLRRPENKRLIWKLKAWLDIGEKAHDFPKWLAEFKLDLCHLIHIGMNISEDKDDDDAVIIQMDIDPEPDAQQYIFTNKEKRIVGTYTKFFRRKGWYCVGKFPNSKEAEPVFNDLMNQGYRPIDSRVFDEYVQ